jgi:hypothetical protein
VLLAGLLPASRLSRIRLILTPGTLLVTTEACCGVADLGIHLAPSWVWSI